MRNRQLGVSLGGLIVGAFILIILALLGMKVLPSYMNFMALKKGIATIAQEQPTGSPAAIRKAFESRQAIDDYKKVGPADLEVGKEGGQVVISFAYREEVPLFGNLGLYMDFAATARPQ